MTSGTTPSYRVSQCLDEAFSHSFLTQYISLILFVLIFSIAAFMPKTPTVATLTPPKVLPARVGEDAKSTRSPLAALASSSLFAPGSTRLQSDDLDGVVMFLTTHDVEVEAIVSEPASSHDLLRMGRLEALSDFFVSRGVPRTAIRVIGVEGPLAEVSLRVFRVEAK